MGGTFEKYAAGSNDWQLPSFICQMVSWATTGPGFPGAVNTIIKVALASRASAAQHRLLRGAFDGASAPRDDLLWCLRAQ